MNVLFCILTFVHLEIHKLMSKAQLLPFNIWRSPFIRPWSAVMYPTVQRRQYVEKVEDGKSVLKSRATNARTIFIKENTKFPLAKVDYQCKDVYFRKNIETNHVLRKPNCCGITKYLPARLRNNEISGGVEARPHEFPWIVRLHGGCAEGGCAGSLISPSFVLSAFHCTIYSQTDQLCDQSLGRTRAYFGMHKIDMRLLKTYYSIPVIDTKYPRRGRNDNPLESHDFVLMILQYPVRFSENVAPICLPTQNQEFKNEIATTAGWGMYELRSPQSPTLLKVDLVVSPLKYQFCKMFGTQVIRNKLGIVRDPCSGDSGETTVPFLCI